MGVVEASLHYRAAGSLVQDANGQTRHANGQDQVWQRGRPHADGTVQTGEPAWVLWRLPAANLKGQGDLVLEVQVYY